VIEIRDLCKAYGTHVALRDVVLTVDAGDMFGLIGPNGAGKTTLIRIIATLLKQTSGTAKVDGRDVRQDAVAVRRLIGYMPDFFGVYEELRVRHYLEFFASAYGLRGPKRSSAVDGVLQLTDLGDRREAMISTLSRGMQQRLGLARVLLHDPKLLLLDEPASGLDPRARIEIRELLKELRRMGKTILISSHILADLADLCNKIALIERGRVVYAGGVKEAMAQVAPADVWLVEVFDETERARTVLGRLPTVDSIEAADGHLRVKLKGEKPEVNALARALDEAGLRLKSLRMAEATLEEAFLKLTKGHAP
jgi:ABC-2 type transport system ATP-binding protein